MRRGLKITFGLSATALIAIVALLVIGFVAVRKSFPKSEGTVRADALEAPVEVFRDEFGVPHVIAQNDHDLYFAIGYVHAQDRLWQMDLIRRIATGRLAEVLGPEALEIDRMFRIMGLRRVAQRSEPLLDEATHSALSAYADGVSEFILHHEGRLPVEFDILGYEPEAWTVEHSLLVGRLMSWELNYARWIDILRGIVTEKMGPARALELYPDWPEGAPVIVPGEQSHRSTASSGLELLQKDASYRRLLGVGGFQTGSNAWAVAGSRTSTGQPLLANDTHLFLTSPARFYELHAVAPTVNVAGMTVAGVPFVIIGRTRAISWGVTNAMLDDADYFVETVDSLDYPSRVRWRDQWIPIETYRDTISVKGDRSVVLTSYWTPHGPIINRVEPGAPLYGELLSFQWTGLEPSADARTFYLLNRAKNWREFKRALTYFNTPSQNFIYADTSGTIGYQLAGKVPMRAASQATVPVPGWAEAFEWRGFVRTDLLPSVVNPDQGFVASANNKIASEAYPYYLSTYWEPDWRIRRITELLGDGGPFTVEDMKSMQRDVSSVHARELVPVILAAYDSIQVSDPLVRDCLTYFRNWTYEMHERDVATSVFHAFLSAVVRNTFSDELGSEAFRLYDTLATPPLLAITKALQSPNSVWFDRVGTEPIEGRDEIIRMSLEEAVRYLKGVRGDDIKEWTWGSIHQAEFRHLFGENTLLRPIFDPGPFPTPGSHSTLNNGYYRLDQPFENDVGPAMRMVFDMADSTGYDSVLPPGQSGQVFHQHYDDQVTLWLTGGTKRTLLLEGAIRRAGYRRLLLAP